MKIDDGRQSWGTIDDVFVDEDDEIRFEVSQETVIVKISEMSKGHDEIDEENEGDKEIEITFGG